MRWLVAAVAAVAAIAVLGVAVRGWVGESNRGQSEQPRTVLADFHQEGCSYLFHDARRWQSIIGTWQSPSSTWLGRVLRWGKRPAGQGRWGGRLRRYNPDNVAVGVGGALVPSRGTRFSGGCLNAWNRLPQRSWQRTVARNYRVARVFGWAAIS